MGKASSVIRKILGIWGFVAKLISSTLMSLFGVAVTIMGFMNETGFFSAYHYNPLRPNNGDVYTNIHNAITDMHYDLISVGWGMENALSYLYILGGILMVIVGGYWFACALSSFAKKDIFS